MLNSRTMEIQNLLTAAGLVNLSSTMMMIVSQHVLLHFKEFTFEDAVGIANEINGSISERALHMRNWVQQTPYWRESVPEKLRGKLLPLLAVLATHKALDQELSAELKKIREEGVKISCQKKCSFCCHYPVSLSDTEAYYLALMLKVGGLPIDEELLEAQQSLGSAAWMLADSEKTRCVFLSKEKTCMVYHSRPSSCRSYMVSSSPEFCDQDKYRGQKVEGIGLLEVELLSSTQSSFGGGLLPHKLKKAFTSLTPEDLEVFVHMTSWHKSLRVGN